MYYWFYHFNMNFSYTWWLFYFFLASFIIPKAIKFRLYNIKNLFYEFILLFKWLNLIFLKFNFILIKLKNKFFFFFSSWFKLLQNKFFIIDNIIINSFFNFLLYFFFLQDKKYIFIWGYYNINYYLPLQWIKIQHYKNFFKQYLYLFIK